MFTSGRKLLLLFAVFAPIGGAAAQGTTTITNTAAPVGIAAAQGTTPIPDIPPPIRQAVQMRDSRIDDVVVSIVEIPPKVIRLDIANDPRFHYVRPLNGVTAIINEGSLALQTSRFEDWFAKTAPDPSLYPAPASMTVFSNPTTQQSFIVRMDNSKFLGMTPYVVCRRAPPRRVISNCSIDAALTDMVTLQVSFSDDRIPVADWPEFLKSMEAGIRQVVSRCEKLLFGERCRH